MGKIQTRIIQFFIPESKSQRRIVKLVLIALLVFSMLIAGTAGAANFISAENRVQESIKGEWLIDFSRPQPDEIQLTIMRRSGTQMNSSGIALSELQGLTREQALGVRRDVNFRLVREAGTFNF